MKVEELVIQILADTTDLKKGLKDVQEGMGKTEEKAEKTAKHMEEQGKRAGQFFGNIKKEMLALAAVALSIKGVTDFVTNTANSLAGLGRSAAVLGVTSQKLDALQNTVKAFGGTSQETTASLLSLQNAIVGMTKFGQGSAVTGVLYGLGINIRDAKGNAKNSLDVLREVANEWHKRHYTMAEMSISGSQLGLGQGMINAMADPAKFDKLFGSFLKSSAATKQAVQQAEQLQVIFTKLDQQWSSTKDNIFVALGPAIIRLTNELANLSTWFGQHKKEINQFFIDLDDEINSLVKDVGGWKTALEILAVFVVGSWSIRMIAGIGKVAKSFGPILVAMAAISAWNKINDIQNEAKKQGKTPGQYLVDQQKAKHEHDIATGNTAGDIFGRWWNGIFHHDQSGLPRGIRNNNPGNLNYAGQFGATKEGGSGGRFAVFANMQEGIAALYRQLQLYASRGINTISAIVKKYAPSSDGNDVAAYIKALVKTTGHNANEVLNFNDLPTMLSLIKGITSHENGAGHLSTAQIMKGIQLGASSSARRYANNYHSEANIGQITINTQATDAKGIANSIGGELRRNNMTATTNGGLS